MIIVITAGGRPAGRFGPQKPGTTPPRPIRPVSLAAGSHLAMGQRATTSSLGWILISIRLGEDPCVSAATTGAGFHIESIAAQARWPAFVAHAAERGINAIISRPLAIESRAAGALNSYPRTARAFAPPQRKLALLLARQVSAVPLAYAREEIAAGSPPGILMEREGNSGDEAHGAPRGVSRASDTGPARQAAQSAASTQRGPPAAAHSG